jgi:signal transduction histidine kinase
LRIGRTLAKAGRLREALDAYTALARNADAQSPTVAMAFYNRCDLLAQFGQIGELNQCAALFFSGLVKARWRLDEARYTFYVGRTEAWLPRAGADGALDDLRGTERAKRALADAARVALGEVRAFDATQRPAIQLFPSAQGAGATVALITHDDGLRLFVMSDQCAGRHIWQRVVQAAEPGFEATLVGPGGVRLAGNGDAAGSTPAAARAERSVESHGRTWQVQAQPTDLAGRSEAAARRQRVYYILLLVVLGSLGASGYFAIRTVRKELEIARMKSEFVSAVSHEFRSPLTAIRHLSELLHTGRIAEGVKPAEYFELIFKESQRLTRLVENLLDLARIEEGRHEFRLERVETESWLRAAVDAFISASVGSATRIEVAVNGPMADIHADAAALARALHNLLDNAVKYSADPAVVQVSATMAGGVVAIAVRDRGIGIAPEQHRAVFGRFHRAPNALDRPGTGLGLALVQRIVAAHGGTVTIESALGEGTTVTLTLPASESE